MNRDPRRALREAALASAFAALLLGAAASLHPPRSVAHQGNSTAYAAITVSGRTVRYSLTLSAIPDGALAKRIDPRGAGTAARYEPLLEAIARHLQISSESGACAAVPARVIAPSATVLNITAIVDYACPAPVRELSIVDNLFQVMGDDLQTLARIGTATGTQQFAFATESRSARVVVHQPAPVAGGIASFMVLGGEHILFGYDHLLFLVALLVCGGSLQRLLLIVTGFTLSHSLTLALAVTGLVTVPGRMVEALIALSIAYVAAENLLPRLALSRRWAVSFVFGLVHGFGFSNVLREMDLPPENLLAALLGFNLGVELGQILVLLALSPLIIWCTRVRGRSPILVATSSVILVIGLGLFIERAIG